MGTYLPRYPSSRSHRGEGGRRRDSSATERGRVLLVAHPSFHENTASNAAERHAKRIVDWAVPLILVLVLVDASAVETSRCRYRNLTGGRRRGRNSCGCARVEALTERMMYEEFRLLLPISSISDPVCHLS